MALTANQKKIIEAITNEFEILNNTKKNNSFNIVDVNKLKLELNRIEVEKRNLKVHNDAMIDIRKIKVKKYVDLLNDDFKNGNLPIKAEIHCGNTIAIVSDKNFIGIDNTYLIRIDVMFINEETEFGTKYIGTTFQYNNEFRCDDLKILLAHYNIQSKLLLLIKKTNEKIRNL